MGMSSFMLMDKPDEDIWNIHSEMPTTLVDILLPSGVYMSGVTNDGYLRFGGKCYFEILAEFNGYSLDDDENSEHDAYYLTEKGRELFYGHEDSIQYPKVVSHGFKGKYTDLPHRPEFCLGGRQGMWND